VLESPPIANLRNVDLEISTLLQDTKYVINFLQNKALPIKLPFLHWETFAQNEEKNLKSTHFKIHQHYSSNICTLDQQKSSYSYNLVNQYSTYNKTGLVQLEKLIGNQLSLVLADIIKRQTETDYTERFQMKK